MRAGTPATRVGLVWDALDEISDSKEVLDIHIRDSAVSIPARL